VFTADNNNNNNNNKFYKCFNLEAARHSHCLCREKASLHGALSLSLSELAGRIRWHHCRRSVFFCRSPSGTGGALASRQDPGPTSPCCWPPTRCCHSPSCRRHCRPHWSCRAMSILSSYSLSASLNDPHNVDRSPFDGPRSSALKLLSLVIGIGRCTKVATQSGASLHNSVIRELPTNEILLPAQWTSSAPGRWRPLQ